MKEKFSLFFQLYKPQFVCKYIDILLFQEVETMHFRFQHLFLTDLLKNGSQIECCDILLTAYIFIFFFIIQMDFDFFSFYIIQVCIVCLYRLSILHCNNKTHNMQFLMVIPIE